jgi:hypothetical protein
MELVVRAALIGIGATLVMDLWTLLLKQVYGVPSLDYALVGRWLGHMPAGRFRHASILAAPVVRGERVIGWSAHYAIGVIFAGLLLAAFGQGWARQPYPGPAILVGLLTVVAPFFIMQPCMGFGIAASKAPSPNIARLRSLITHLIFGVGLYGSAWALAQLTTQ